MRREPSGLRKVCSLQLLLSLKEGNCIRHCAFMVPFTLVLKRPPGLKYKSFFKIVKYSGSGCRCDLKRLALESLNCWLQHTVRELLTFPVTWLFTRVCAGGITYCCSTVNEHLRSMQVAYLNKETAVRSAN